MEGQFAFPGANSPVPVVPTEREAALCFLKPKPPTRGIFLVKATNIMHDARQVNMGPQDGSMRHAWHRREATEPDPRQASERMYPRSRW